MKLSILYLSLLFSFGYSQSIPDRINEVIEKLRDALPENVEIPDLNLDLPDSKLLTGFFNATDINLQGLKEFDADIKYFLSIPTSFVLKLEAVRVDLDYITNLALLNMSLLTISGEGKASIVPNLTITGKIGVSIIPLNLTIKEMEMHMDGKATFEGLLDDEIFSKEFGDVLGDVVSEVFNANENIFSTAIEDTINSAIWGIISNMTNSSDVDIKIFQETIHEIELNDESYEGFGETLDELINVLFNTNENYLGAVIENIFNTVFYELNLDEIQTNEGYEIMVQSLVTALTQNGKEEIDDI